MSSSDRALVNAFKEISNMADRINLPRTIVDRANNLFKQVHDGKNLKGRSNDAIASASLYIACRQEGVPRTFKEICAVSKISKKEIARCFKLILNVFDTSMDIIKTEDFMSRFCANLGKWHICNSNFIHLLNLDCIFYYLLRFAFYSSKGCFTHCSQSCGTGHCTRQVTHFSGCSSNLHGLTSF
jgi:transcription initiation factor TFIIIB Brf1 subunit/transcription initiation factor TFIIB